MVAQTVKNLPAMQETQEDPLEKKIATHSSSCLENSMEKGTWWATVYGLCKELDTIE